MFWNKSSNVDWLEDRVSALPGEDAVEDDEDTDGSRLDDCLVLEWIVSESSTIELGLLVIWIPLVFMTTFSWKIVNKAAMSKIEIETTALKPLLLCWYVIFVGFLVDIDT